MRFIKIKSNINSPAFQDKDKHLSSLFLQITKIFYV